MAEAAALKRGLIGQFARPHGVLGWLAGRIMAAHMRAAGLGRTRIARLTALSPMAVCVIGSAAG